MLVHLNSGKKWLVKLGTHQPPAVNFPPWCHDRYAVIVCYSVVCVNY